MDNVSAVFTLSIGDPNRMTDTSSDLAEHEGTHCDFRSKDFSERGGAIDAATRFEGFGGITIR